MITLAASEAAEHWILVLVSIIGAAGAVGAAWASNINRKTAVTHSVDVSSGLEEVSNQVRKIKAHVIEVVAWKQGYAGSAFPDAHAINEWVSTIANLEIMMKAHIEWEQSDHGKYSQLFTEIAVIRKELLDATEIIKRLLPKEEH